MAAGCPPTPPGLALPVRLKRFGEGSAMKSRLPLCFGGVLSGFVVLWVLLSSWAMAPVAHFSFPPFAVPRGGLASPRARGLRQRGAGRGRAGPTEV